MSSPPNETLVLVGDTRPAGPSDRCYYCDQALGQPHLRECVIPQRRVIVRMVVEYEISVPRAWTQDQIEFHRNESSWCATNAFSELKDIPGCLCEQTSFTYVGEAAMPNGA